MKETGLRHLPATKIDQGLVGLCQIASFYRIPSDPTQLQHQLALKGTPATAEDIIRAAKILQLKSRIVRSLSEARLRGIPVPALVKLRDAGFVVFGGIDQDGRMRIQEPLTRSPSVLTFAE